MEFNSYLNTFQKATNQLDKKLLQEKQIEVAVGVVLNSVYLKLYKKSWANPSEDPLTAESRIFFSIWINDTTLSAQKIYYNIHAFKLRKLKGYSIESKKFADTFRTHFKDAVPNWENVSVKYGPLTLMEGSVKFEAETLEEVIVKLSHDFLKIDHLIDHTLAEFKK